MIDLDKVDWEGIVISAIENPQKQTANFEELNNIAVNKEKHFNKDKIVFENEKYRLCFRIGWDKSKFFFQYEHIVVDKQSNKRMLGVDEAHGNRHLHSGDFVIPNPETLLEKIEHPILSFIIKSEPESRRKEWIRVLAKELKDSQIKWREHLNIK